MTDLSPSELLAAKALATEVALLALLREKRDDPKFWGSLDKLTQIVLTMKDLQVHADPVVRAQAEAAQNWLDAWRGIAGQNPNDPAPRESGPFPLPQSE